MSNNRVNGGGEGGGDGSCQKRRSALTSAFEELALQAEEEQESGFSAHLRFDDAMMGHGGSPSITVGSPSGMRGPSFPSPHFRIMNADTEHHPYGNAGVDGSGAGGDRGGGHASSPMHTRSAELADQLYHREEDLAQSAGRQHGSFSCLSMLAEECSSPYEAQRGGYSFTAGQSAFTTPFGGDNDMAFAFSLGDCGGGCIKGGSVADDGGDRNGVNIGGGLGGGGGIGGGITAVLDWELSTLGAPYSDIAYNCMPYHLPPGGDGAAYPSFACVALPPGVPSERQYVAAWSRAAGLPNPMEGGSWPFYVALSLFRGAAILAGVRARAAAGNAAAANASAAGQVVEILASRALVVAGVYTLDGGPKSVAPPPSPLTTTTTATAASARRSSSASASSSPPSPFFCAGFEPSERAAALLVKLRRFMSEHVYPAESTLEAHAASPERWTVCPKVEELKALAKRAGLWNLWLPADSRELLKLTVSSEEDSELLTGPGLTNLEYAHLAGEMGASVWASEAFNCSAPDTGNMEVLLRYGTEQQQSRWLTPLLRGEIRSCFAMTEPEVASSDATNIRSSVGSDGADYVLNGRKWWTSGACDSRCKLVIFMGKTSPDGGGAPRHRQQSMVLVPMDAPGVTVVRPLPVFGYDDAPHGHAEMLFKDVRVPAASSVLLGEGRGFEIAQGRLGPGRLHHCMRLIGMGERALELAAKRAGERVAFGKPLAANGSVLQTLGRSRVALDGARLATLEAARRLDVEGNKVAKGAIAACKVAAPAAALFVIDASIQIHGALGVCDDTPLARMFAGARTLRLADGPDEVHLETIARMEVRRAKM